MRAISDSLSEPCPSVLRYRHAATSCNETSPLCQRAFSGWPTHSPSPFRALQPATRRSHMCTHARTPTHTQHVMRHAREEVSSLKSCLCFFCLRGHNSMRRRSGLSNLPLCRLARCWVLSLVLCAEMNLCYIERSVHIGYPSLPLRTLAELRFFC